LYSLRLATDAQQGRWFQLLDDIQSARVWPPFHGILAAGVMLVGGLDYRLAVLPSLAGWVGTVLLAFLVARRCLGSAGGNLAGLVAGLFVLVSPSHRAYATDIMLESLGACLTLLVLYAYLVVVQQEGESLPRSPWPGRCLGLALTALFLHKYNYWLLVVLALLAAECLARPAWWWQGLRGMLQHTDWRGWLVAQLRHPLTYVLALLLLVSGIVQVRGDRPVFITGKSIGLYPPHNILHAAYVVLFLRLWGWWRSGGRDWVSTFDDRLRQVVVWHLCPLALWFLLPKHPSYFLWYLSLGNAAESQKFDLLAGLRDCAHWLVEDYHLALWSAVVVAFLCGVALLSWRRLRPGGLAVFCLVLLAAVLTVSHPNRKGRNLHSWLAGAWVMAGVGLGSLVAARGPRAGYTPLSMSPRLRFGLVSVPRLRFGLVWGAVAGLAWESYPGLLATGHAPEGGPHPQAACMLDLTDVYLATLDQSRCATILAAVPVKPLAQWTVLERYGRLDRLEEHWYGFGNPGAENRQEFQNWLWTTKCDTLVYFDRLPGPDRWEPVAEVLLHAELRDQVLGQQVFRLVEEKVFPRHGCRVLVWRKDTAGARRDR
jgi:hypothetical protein